MWVTQPERPKGVKDEFKRTEGPPARSWGPEGPQTIHKIEKYETGNTEGNYRTHPGR